MSVTMKDALKARPKTVEERFTDAMESIAKSLAVMAAAASAPKPPSWAETLMPLLKDMRDQARAERQKPKRKPRRPTVKRPR